MLSRVTSKTDYHVGRKNVIDNDNIKEDDNKINIIGFKYLVTYTNNF